MEYGGILFSLFLVLCFQTAIFGAGLWDIEPRLGYQTTWGYSTYQIGGNTNFDKDGSVTYHFPISELKFPLNVSYPTLSLKWQPLNQLRLSGKIGTNFSRAYSGELEDSDWLDTVTQKDIFSISKADLKILEGSSAVQYLLNTVPYNASTKGQFWFGFSYDYQKLDYVASKLTQTSLSDNSTITVTDHVIAYQRSTKIPYFTLSAEHIFQKMGWISDFILHASAGYSPWVHITDTDDHLLRKKMAIGTLDGTATIGTISTQFFLNSNWSLTLGASHQLIETNGSQVQTRYEKTSEGDPGFITQIDARDFSRTTSLYGFLTCLIEPQLEFRSTIPETSKPSALFFLPLFIAYWIPDSESQYAHPVLGVEIPLNASLFLGIGFEQSINKVNRALSQGIMTQFPLYLRTQFKLYDQLSCDLSSGYTFATNKMDDQAKSDLARNGFTNASEAIASYLFASAGLSYAVTEDLNTFVQYKLAEAIVQFASDSYRETQPMNMSQIQAGIRLKTPI